MDSININLRKKSRPLKKAGYKNVTLLFLRIRRDFQTSINRKRFNFKEKLNGGHIATRRPFIKPATLE